MWMKRGNNNNLYGDHIIYSYGEHNILIYNTIQGRSQSDWLAGLENLIWSFTFSIVFAKKLQLIDIIFWWPPASWNLPISVGLQIIVSLYNTIQGRSQSDWLAGLENLIWSFTFSIVFAKKLQLIDIIFWWPPASWNLPISVGLQIIVSLGHYHTV